MLHWDYKNFNCSNFNADLKAIFTINLIHLCREFDQMFLKILDKHPPLKRKLLRFKSLKSFSLYL